MRRRLRTSFWSARLRHDGAQGPQLAECRAWGPPHMATFSPFSRTCVVFRVLRGIAISAHQICTNLQPPLKVIHGILAVGEKEVELCTRGGLTNLKHHPSTL